MRHISTINPIAAFFAGPATRSRQVGRPARASAARDDRFHDRSAAEVQTYTAPTSESVDSPSPPPQPPQRAAGERTVRSAPVAPERTVQPSGAGA